MPLYQKMPASPISVAVAALIRPSLTGTSFAASYTNTLTGTGSRFLTQVTTSNTLQIVSVSGGRHNTGAVSVVTNDGSLNFSTFRANADASLHVIPLDSSSPSTGSTFITQKGNTPFTISSGSYFIMAGSGPIGPYSMTLGDSNYKLDFSYDASYLAWALAVTTTEMSNGIQLVPAAGLTPGTVFYLADKILRIA